jgi:hypothetical protein
VLTLSVIRRFLVHLQIQTHSTQAGTKRFCCRKEEVKISLFADDMIIYVIHPKNSTREVLTLINSFSEVSGYEINSNKSVALLYKQDEKEIREITLFKIVTNNIKYLAVTLNKKVKDLYD